MRRHVVLIAVLFVTVLVPASAHAQHSGPCTGTDGSTSSAGGDWDTWQDWSNGTPSLQCSTVIGGSVISHGGSTKGLEIDSGSLLVVATTDMGGNPVSAQIDDRGDSLIAHGAGLVLEETGANPGQASIGGSFQLVNDGSISTTASVPTAQNAGLLMPLTNNADGSVAIGADTRGSNTTFVNNGTWTVDAGKTMLFTGGGAGPTVTLSAGTYANAGTTVFDGGTLNHAGGDVTGHPIDLCGATGNLGGTGTAAFDFVQIPSDCSGGGLGSDIAAGETVRMIKNGAVGGPLIVSSGSFTNHGTLELGGTGTNEQDQLVGGGTLTNAGTLKFTQPRDLQVQKNIVNQGTASIDASTTVGQSSYAYTQQAGTTTVNGTLSAGGNGGLILAGGTLANPGITRGYDAAHSGGTLTGNPVQVCGTLTPGGPGVAAFDFVQDANCNGGAIAADIAAGETVRMLKSTTISDALIVHSDTFTNRGTLELGGTGTDQQDVLTGNGTLTNVGTLLVTQPRDLQIQKSVVNQGTFTVATNTPGMPTSVLVNGNSAFTQAGGTTTVGAGSTLTVGGLFTISGGTLANAGAIVGQGDLAATGGSATGQPATFEQADTLTGTGSGTFVLTGGEVDSDVPAGYDLIVDGLVRTAGATASGLVNHGTFELRGGAQTAELFGQPLDNQGTISAKASAAGRTIDSTLSNEGVIDVAAPLGLSHALTSSGTITVHGGSTLSAPAFTQSAGTTTLVGSGDALTTSSTVAVTGGTLAGAGTVHADVTNAGTVSPAPSPSTLTIDGTYTQAPAGFLTAAVTSTGNDRLHVTGAATLDGTLQVTTAGGYAPPKDQVYTVVDAASVTGTFAATAGLDSGPYTVAYGPAAVTLTAQGRATPPPATPTLSIGDATVANPRGGSTVATFPVTLSAASLTAVTVHYATSNGTASAPDEYLAAAGDVTIAPGQTTASIPVTVFGDSTPGAAKTFFVDLSQPSGATLATARGTGSILGKLTLDRVSPDQGGDAGTTQLVVEGAGLSGTDTLTLTGSGHPPITATDVTATADGRSLTAIVTLKGAPLGARDVVVASGTGGGTATLPGAFTVVKATPPDIEADWTGRPTVRPGTQYTGRVTYHNSGNTDAANALIEVDGLPSGARVTADGDVDGALPQDDGEQQSVILTVPRVGAGSYGSVGLTFTVGKVPAHTYPIDADVRVLQSSVALTTVPTDVTLKDASVDAAGHAHWTLVFSGGTSGTMKFEAYHGPALTKSRFLVSTTGDGYTLHLAEPLPTGNCRVAGDPYAEETSWTCPDATVPPAISTPGRLGSRNAPAESFLYEDISEAGEIVHGWGEKVYHASHVFEARKAWVEAEEQSEFLVELNHCLGKSGLIDEQYVEALDASAKASTGIAIGNFLASLPEVPGGLTGSIVGGAVRDYATEGLTGLSGQGYRAQLTSFMASKLQAEGKLPNIDFYRHQLFHIALSRCSKTAKHHLEAKHPAEARESGDPNDMVGPAGPSARHYVDGKPGTSNYTAYFENLPTAGAPAYSVTVSDKLDASKLDPSTVALGPITIANTTLTPPPGVKSWSTQLDMRPGRDALVDVTGKLTGDTLNWRFTTIDPTTHQPVKDVDSGFLPPDTTAPNGEGSVSFAVQPKPGLANAAQTGNSASIVFDTNAAITTPVWQNTVDRTRPTARFVSAKAKRKHRIALRWKGHDGGSGIGAFDVSMRRGHGAWTSLLGLGTEKRTTVGCKRRSRYQFRITARDRVGNAQVKPRTSRKVRCR